MTALDVDPSRAARAAEALRDGDVRIEAGDRPGTYTVTSFTRARTYTVHLDDRTCTCPDAAYRGSTCKHQLAVILTAGLNGNGRDR